MIGEGRHLQRHLAVLAAVVGILLLVGRPHAEAGAVRGGAVSAGAALVPAAQVAPQPAFSDQHKIRTLDGAAGDSFGAAVALSANDSLMLVGAPRRNNVTGAAYIFARSGTGWVPWQTLQAADGAQQDQFGTSVALAANGSIALVGAPVKNTATGAAYVFVRSGTGWMQQQKLVAADGASPDDFGRSVALSSDGSIALVGAWNKNGGMGAAYVFVRSGATWTQQQEIVAADRGAFDAFGVSVALSADGSTALVGATGGNGNTGAAYVFTRSGSTWSQQQEFVATDGVGADSFGASVALATDGSTALVGAPGRDGSIGAAYVFTRSGTTWSQQQELNAVDQTSGMRVGASAALSADGSTALVGAPGPALGTGAAYVFTRSGSTWSQPQALVAADGTPDGGFGASVALAADGSAALVGAPDQDYDGAAYLSGISTAFDTTPPHTGITFTGTPAGGGAFVAPVTVTLTAADDLSGVAGTVYQLDGGAPTIYGAPFVVSTLGTHTLTFHSTDMAGNVEPLQSFSFTIVRYRATTTTLSAVPTTSTFGQTVSFTVTVQPQAGSGIPTGAVSFKDGSTTLATLALSAAGSAVYRTSSLAPGSHGIIATYAGSGTYASSTSAPLAETVARAATTTSLTGAPNPAVTGATVTFTARVAVVAPGAGTPGGAVTFQDGSAVLASVPLGAGGTASYSAAGLALGTHPIHALYVGSADDLGSAAVLAEQVAHPSTTTLSGTPNPTIYGQTVAFTATVSGAFGMPTGSVTFRDGANSLGTVALTANGTATFSTKGLTGGVHSITAAYAGNSIYVPSTSAALTQTMSRAASTMAVSIIPNPASFGAPVAFTAIVGGPGAVPTGAVTFKDGATVLAAVPLDGGGTAHYTTASLSQGPHTIWAVYSGNNSYTASSIALPIIVQ